MSNTASAITIILANGALLVAVVGAQAFWVARSIDALRAEMYRGFDEIARNFGRVDTKLDRLEGIILRDHGERIARLEERERA